jgi:hypothetical protein
MQYLKVEKAIRKRSYKDLHNAKHTARNHRGGEEGKQGCLKAAKANSAL